MKGYLARRLSLMGVTLVAFLCLVFFLIQAQPGDFTAFYVLDPDIPPETRQEIQKALGIDQPVWRQFFTYVGNFFQGDLGVSFGNYPKSVMSVIWERLPRTVLLFVTAAVISFYLGFILGKVIAWRRGRLVEYTATLGGVYLYTVFTPWFALMMIWLFAVHFDWLPAGKFISPEEWIGAPVDSNYVLWRLLWTAIAGSAFLFLLFTLLRRFTTRWAGRAFWGAGAGSVGLMALSWWLSGYGPLALDIVQHMVLPVLTLTAISFAGTMLLTRNSMLETLREDYVFAAQARGLPQNVVRDRYVARNALLPVVTSLVFSLAAAIDGGVITETVFAWPGLGLTLLDSVVTEDLPLAVGAFIFTGVFALVAHLIADVLYVYLDPRIRYQ